MGWLPVLLSVVATILFYRTGHAVLMVLAILTSIGGFWSWGVMHNFAVEQARRRPGFTGGFYDITDDEADFVPDWIAWVNAILSFVSLGLLVTGVVFACT